MSSTDEGINIAVEKNCLSCNEPIPASSRFCRHCGFIQNTDAANSGEQKWESIKHIALFFIFDAVICCIACFIDVFKTLSWSITFDIALAIIALTFFCDNWSTNKTLLVWHNFSLLKLLSYCAAAALGSFAISYLVGWLNETLFSEEFSFYTFYIKHSYGKELMLFFVAVMPALFES